MAQTVITVLLLILFCGVLVSLNFSRPQLDDLVTSLLFWPGMLIGTIIAPSGNAFTQLVKRVAATVMWYETGATLAYVWKWHGYQFWTFFVLLLPIWLVAVGVVFLIAVGYASLAE